MQPTKVGLIASFMMSCLLLSVGTGGGTSVGGGMAPRISVAVSNGLDSVNYTTAGSPVAIDVLISAQDTTPFSSDVYVGILSPDGQSTSLLAHPQMPTQFVPVLVTGPPVPFLAKVLLVKDTGARLEVPSFAAGGAEGWYIVYGIVVGAGRDPSDPRQWVTSTFVPVRVTRAASP